MSLRPEVLKTFSVTDKNIFYFKHDPSIREALGIALRGTKWPPEQNLRNCVIDGSELFSSYLNEVHTTPN